MKTLMPAYAFSQEPLDTVEAQRRRRGQPGGPSGQGQIPGGPSQSGGGGGGGWIPTGSGGGGGGLPGGRKTGLSIGGVILLVIVYFLIRWISGGSSPAASTQDNSQYLYDTQVSNYIYDTPASNYVSQATPIAAPTTYYNVPQQSSSSNPNQTWTVMLYQDADDPILEQDIYMDLNEAESVGSNSQVNIVAQIDRYKGAYQGDGDWTTARRFYLTKDHDLFHVHSKMLQDLGEVSMADPQTLVDFVTWAVKAYPADKYVLILSDHGMGWPGGMTDPAPAGIRDPNAPFASIIDANMMYLSDIDNALGKIRQQTGIDKFELVGLDACLMSDLEVYAALAPHAHYAVTSQETEPSLGWAYAGFLQALEDNPGMNGGELGRQIVSTFIVKDERILDPQARLDFLRQGSPLSGMFGGTQDVDPTQLSNQISRSVTLTAVNLDEIPALMDTVNQFAYVLQNEDQTNIQRAKTYAQSFTSIFGDQVPPSFIDLGNFAQILQQESSSSDTRNAAAAVINQVNQVVVAEKHGREKPGATGISIYFPNSTLYQHPVAGINSYAQIASRFVQQSSWDDFLAYYFTNQQFEMNAQRAVLPAQGSRAVDPGAGNIQASALSLSQSYGSYNQSVTMQTTITGSNIGYIYLFVGYYDDASKQILVADKDYLESQSTRQIGNLYYPVWSQNTSFNFKYTWDPALFYLQDGSGNTSAYPVVFKPELYGATYEEAVYTVDGTYTSSSTGKSQYARMYFVNGTMTRMIAFTGQQAEGPYSDVIPQSGDTITLTQTWLKPDASGAYSPVTYQGDTLTFGATPFTWVDKYPFAGKYVLGFVITDLTGAETEVLEMYNIR